jgi:hypothetical protein
MSDYVAVSEKEITTQETNMESWTLSEKESSRQKYGCEILLENGSFEQVCTKDAPNDARIVTYEVDGQIRYDLTRGSKVSKIFDMYWDKFRNGIKKIEFGHGNISPKLWGYKTPETKKRK